MNRKICSIVFMAFLVVAMMLGTAFAADSQPIHPDALWGTITSADGSAVNGGIIKAYIGTRLVDSVEFTGNSFGTKGGLDRKLIIQGPESDLGKVVTFVVNGITATTTEIFLSGQVKEMIFSIPYSTITTGGGGGGGTVVTPPLDIKVGGSDANPIGQATDSIENGQTLTTITLDSDKLADYLSKTGDNPILSINTKTTANQVVAELNGKDVKALEGKGAIVEVKTPLATYTIPAKEINIDAISQDLGSNVALKDIKVQIEVEKTPDAMVKVVNSSAEEGKFTLVVPPVEFKVTCTYNGKTLEVSKFNAYVERTIPIPDGVDPSKITTGVVVNVDGTITHVPTQIIVIGGKYYAKISSLTNSTYTVIWHPITFKDVEKHWAKDDVNDMGSRMVVKGRNATNFDPDKSITRAEFAVIVMRALGISDKGKSTKLKDIKATDWYYGSVAAASENKIINGYTDGTFKPNNKITREEAMAIMYKALALTKLDRTISKADVTKQLSQFKDSKNISDWAKTFAAVTVHSGIIGGASGNISAKTNITRAETAAIIKRTLKKANLI